jgi:hypothetical protein
MFSIRAPPVTALITLCKPVTMADNWSNKQEDGQCQSRHSKDYGKLSATPDQFKEFAAAVGQMQKTEPNYSAQDLAYIHVPVTIVQSEHDEFIKPEHTEYLTRSISRRGIGLPTWREPFRTATKAGAIQHRDECFSQQGFLLKEEEAAAVPAGPLWVISGCACRSAARQVNLNQRTPELERAHLAIRHPPAGRQRVGPAQLTLSDPLHGEQPTADRVVSAE